MSQAKLHLSGFCFAELFTPSGLSKLDYRFLDYLEKANKSLHSELLHYREGKISDPQQISQLVIDGATLLEHFLAKLFNIEEAVTIQRAAVEHETVIAEFKQHFVLREARRLLKKTATLAPFDVLHQWLLQQLTQQNIINTDREHAVAQYAAVLRLEPQRYPHEIEQLAAWCAQALATTTGQEYVQDWVSFQLPKRLDYNHLVAVEKVTDTALSSLQSPSTHWRYRDGFALTDTRMSPREILNEVHYCVYCHKNDGDFCSKGFPVKKNDPNQGLKINPLGDTLTGCPLEEKISEMHVLKKAGRSVAALATVMIDNPMCPATGHRICNDCMKACIYQKQQPVNIPQVETAALTDVLALPWGVEIYDLLTRWNPLRQQQWLAKPYNGKKVLVMGMGPAGFSLAHHLLMEGCAVVGADGLKLEPLPAQYLTTPIHRYETITEALDERVISGFGGVAEYGITVRWDKNFLKLIYLSLSRRPYFQVYGSVRFGGTVTVEDAWALGFDHLAIAVGAGLPRELAIPHSLAPGMRQANDFLMALQLTGAAKTSSLANLQLRLPALVIGGGLTGIDTATEVQAYYLVQIEKVASRYNTLCQHQGEAALRAGFDVQSLDIIDEFLRHAAELDQERRAAAQQQRQPDMIRLLRRWGGVTVVYRRSMQESPAYQRNHEEVDKALEEGIYYAEGLTPQAVLLDHYGHVSGLNCYERVLDDQGQWVDGDVCKKIDAKAIFVATGAAPNIAYEFEHRGTFAREGHHYQCFDWNEQTVEQAKHCKDPNVGPFTSYRNNDHRVSFLGDTHPVFNGSVVKAIASARHTYPFICRTLLTKPQRGDKAEYQAFKTQLSDLFQARVVAVQRHSKGVVELLVRAPMAARNFHLGQFYRLQNYETQAQRIADTLLQTEAMAMLAARQGKELLSFWVLERGVSARLVATFKVGEPVALMGPTGATMSMSEQPENIMIMGGALAFAQLRAIAPLLRAKGHRIVFVACAEHQQLYEHHEQLEDLSDAILWITADSASPIYARRSSDLQANGELITVLCDYAAGRLPGQSQAVIFPLKTINRVLVLGGAELLQQMQQARIGLLSSCFHADTKFFGSVYGAMQCMLKGVCAQCLQWQIDPDSGERTKAVYACSWQTQPLELIDTVNIEERSSQNRAQELLSNYWLDYLMNSVQHKHCGGSAENA